MIPEEDPRLVNNPSLKVSHPGTVAYSAHKLVNKNGGTRPKRKCDPLIRDLLCLPTLYRFCDGHLYCGSIIKEHVPSFKSTQYVSILFYIGLPTRVVTCRHTSAIYFNLSRI